mgnify:CR=1 FL=1
MFGENKRKGKEGDVINHEIREFGGDVKVVFNKARYRRYPSNLSKEEKVGKKKGMDDQNTVNFPADKGRIIVAMDKWESHGGE